MGLWSTNISEDKCFFNYGIVDDEYKVVEVDTAVSTIKMLKMLKKPHRLIIRLKNGGYGQCDRKLKLICMV